MRFLPSLLLLLTCHCSLQAQAEQYKNQEADFMNWPRWSQWRAEGQEIMPFLAHFGDYREKSRKMVFISFPGQEIFFAQQAMKLQQQRQPPPSLEVVKVGFVGDLMAVPNASEAFISRDVLQTLSKLDLTLGNLETPISPSGSFSPLKQALSQYNSPKKYLSAFQFIGKPVFNFLTIANNHVKDRGDLGIKETVENLQANSIATQGYDQRKFVILKRKNMTFGITTACWGFNKLPMGPKVTYQIPVIKGIAPLNPKEIDISYLKQALQEMKEAGVDFKIVFLHWGYEFELFPDPAIQGIGRDLAVAGADLVIGSHPHVLQPYEVIESNGRRSLVFYSMGNFVTDMSHPLTRIGLLQTLQVWKEPSGNVSWSMDRGRLTKIEDREKVLVQFADENSERDSELKKAIHYYRDHLHMQ